MLGPNVGPQVHYMDDRSYVMERLMPWVGRAEGSVEDWSVAAYRLLATKVWNRPALVHDFNWRRNLRAWLEGQDCQGLIRALDTEYDGVVCTPCLTHGDPTLANSYHGPDGLLRLADPLVPGGKVPSLREVDIGKLLQSITGFERVLRGRPVERGQDLKNRAGFLSVELHSAMGPDMGLRRRSWFWLGVHAARVRPYAKLADRPEILAWANAVEAMVMEGLRQ